MAAAITIYYAMAAAANKALRSLPDYNAPPGFDDEDDNNLDDESELAFLGTGADPLRSTE